MVTAAGLGLAWTVASAIALRDDPMTFAFAGLLAAILLLPLARAYAVAMAIVVAAVAIIAGHCAATVVAALAFASWGTVALLVACRVERTLAIVLTIVASLALLSWPTWAATLLLRFDAQPIVDLAARFGPLFAVNRAIDPTDAFTHRPWSYRWMNLGQDVPYRLPATIWPCVLVHSTFGVFGLFSRRRHAVHEGTRRDTNEE